MLAFHKTTEEEKHAKQYTNKKVRFKAAHAQIVSADRLLIWAEEKKRNKLG